MKNSKTFVRTFIDNPRDLIRIFFLILMIGVFIAPQLMFAQIGPANQNHYKTWMVQPQPFQARVLVQDQFMQDSLTLVMREFLSNPTLKMHEGHTFEILNPDQHLTWYRALGRDTSINLFYKNQFESTAVSISQVEFLLVPTQKQGHPPPLNLDHYKAYRITNPQMLHTLPPVMLQDQFDVRYGPPEYIDSLVPTFFLTPAVKNMESQLYDSVTHYVAYQIFPPRMLPLPFWEYWTKDQFGEQYLQIMSSMFLLVPSMKYLPVDTSGSIQGSKFNDLDCNGQRSAGEPGMAGWTINLTGPKNKSVVTGAGGTYSFTGLPPGLYTVNEVLQPGWTQTMPTPIPPGTYSINLLSGQTVISIDFGNCQPPPDTGKNHYKSWRVQQFQVDYPVSVRDQFMEEDLRLKSIDLLSNPVEKKHQGNTFDILKPNDHLTWYKTTGKENNIIVDYTNQFQTTTVSIGAAEYLLLPTFKITEPPLPPHAPPESLDHYKAYKMIDPQSFTTQISLEDQFDKYLFGQPENIDALIPLYFLTPAIKNHELPAMYDSVTHYVAYKIMPERMFPIPYMVQTADQLSPPSHYLSVMGSDILLVPTKKLHFEMLGSLCGYKWDDTNGNGTWDPTESGLANWVITLTKVGGGIFKDTTDAQGAYCFYNLSAGQYIVSEVLQAGWQQTAPPAPGTYTVNLLPGQNLNGFNFGNQLIPPPPPADHYKTWEANESVSIGEHVVTVQDQFMIDTTLRFRDLVLISNPVEKIHGNNTYDIHKPDNHLNWYHAIGKNTLLQVEYSNQLETTSVVISSVKYLLVPAQKIPHNPPVNLDHYKAYEIHNPNWIHTAGLTLEDQFDVIIGQPHFIQDLQPWWFLTPAVKNMEGPMFDSLTHYVAYRIFPDRYFNYQVFTNDQFGSHMMNINQSKYLLVPTKKLSYGPPPDSLYGSLCGRKFNDRNGNGIWDAGEPPLKNWQITLNIGGVTMTTTTDSVGNYCFTRLIPGQYVISEALQFGWQQTAPPLPGTYTVNLGVGQNLTGYDFGNQKIPHDCPLWADRFHKKVEGMGFKIPTDAKLMTRNLAVRDTGDIYICGYTNGWDTKYDYVTINYDEYDNTIWTARYNNTAVNKDDKAYALTVDDQKNVYVAGESDGGSSTRMDIVTVKYNSLGVEQWVKRYNNPVGNKKDAGYAIAVSKDGKYVYVAGETFSGKDKGGIDFITIAYDAVTGAELWVQIHNGPTSKVDKAYAIAVDNDGDVIVTGESDSIKADYFTIAYNGTTGAFQWENYYNNSPTNKKDYAFAIKTDALNNVYVTGASEGTGTSFDYATLKYSTTGAQLWLARYDKLFKKDFGYDLALDSNGDVYVTGASTTKDTKLDYATLKYDGLTGASLWATENRYDGIRKNDIARSVTVCDAEKAVFVTGSSDQGAGRKLDYVTLKIDAVAGGTIWTGRYNGPGVKNDIAYNVAVRPEDCCVVLTGTSDGGKITKMDFATIQGPSSAAVPGPITSPGIYDGESEDEDEDVMPIVFALRQNYPNPFNPITTIQFVLPEEANVSLSVYNILGQELLKVLDNELMESGLQEAEFDASSLASGVYFYRLSAVGTGSDEEIPAHSYNKVMKMLLLK